MAFWLRSYLDLSCLTRGEPAMADISDGFIRDDRSVESLPKKKREFYVHFISGNM
jgi:hypothetical protein